MVLSTEMKNLSEEILASFKQRIKENEEITRRNEELVNDVQKTLNGFRKDHQEMAAVLNANAAALRKNLANGEKERLNTYNELMDGIHGTIASIQKGVIAIQTSSTELINEFTASRAQMAAELDKFFAQGNGDRKQNEKTRIAEFDALMKNISKDLKSINDEVLGIFKNTDDMLGKFEKEHQEMSAELRAELSKNIAERVNYTKTLLIGFQKRLTEISNENQQLAKAVRKDLANSQKQISKSDAERLLDYKKVMNGIHVAIEEFRKEVKEIKKTTSLMIAGFSQDRGQAAEEWGKMQDAIAKLKETGVVEPPKEVARKVEKKEAKKEIPAKKVTETPVETQTVEMVRETPVEAPVQVVPITLEEKILDFINNHPKGVRISEMEESLGETRMKLGYIAKNLLDSGKVQKIDNIYFPLK